MVTTTTQRNQSTKFGWFDAREAIEAGTALADGFGAKRSSAEVRGRRGPDRNDPTVALEDLLLHADRLVRPLGLNFFKKAKLANAFKWKLLENGVAPALANQLTQSLVLHLSQGGRQPVKEVEPAAPPLRGKNSSVRQLLKQGNRALAQRDFAGAIACYQDLLETDPKHLEAHTNLGAALCELGRYGEAEAYLRRASEIDPARAETHCNLGNVLRWQGEMTGAEGAFRRALRLRPNHREAGNSLGLTLAFLGRAAEARACFEKVLKSAPRDVDALFGMGQVAKLEGRFDEAERLFKRVLEVNPKMSSAWAALPTLKKMRPGDDAAWAKSVAALAASEIPPLQEAELRFALGKYHDDIGEYATAFESYERGNELLKTMAKEYKRDIRSYYVDDQIRVYSRKTMAKVGAGGSTSRKPVFVVGMMRSGTSLAEQIIASHPAARGAGELGFWSDAVRAHESEVRAGMPNQETKTKLAQAYLEVLDGHSEGAERVVDKTPVNADYLGVIHSVLPNARIIYMRRDPIDTCLSCYFTQFVTAMNFTLDLSDLAHYYREHQKLMKHWRAVLPRDSLLEVPYAELVSDQEGWTRKILEFLDLDWDERCLDFHRTQRNVMTASGWQVRQKIYTDSVKRWRHYEQFIGPLKGLRA